VLRYTAYLVPTTPASMTLQYIMGLPTPAEWSVGLGYAVQVVYLVGFVVLAKTKALWRET
jgi:ABC-2 type transport system permease protein